MVEIEDNKINAFRQLANDKKVEGDEIYSELRDKLSIEEDLISDCS